MTSCLQFLTPDVPPGGLEEACITSEKQTREACITALALAIIAICLFAAACALLGVGALPPKLSMGLGFIADIGGIFVGALSSGVGVGSLVFLAVAAVRSYQTSQLKNA